MLRPDGCTPASPVKRNAKAANQRAYGFKRRDGACSVGLVHHVQQYLRENDTVIAAISTEMAMGMLNSCSAP